MQPVLNACVYIVDDDAIVRDAMAWLLRSRRLMSQSFASAEAFEQMLRHQFPDTHAPVPTQAGCILLDVRMPGQSGLALFESLIGNGLAQTWPVIFSAVMPMCQPPLTALNAGLLTSVKNLFLTTPWLTVWNRPWLCQTNA